MSSSSFSARFLSALPLLLSFALSFAASAPVNAQTISDFPDGNGKQFVQQICMQCHEPAFLLRQKRTDTDWKKTVTRMSQKGLGGAVENYDAVAAYMFKNFGKEEDTSKVNVNKASADEIATLGLTKEEAAAVIGYRDKHGDFREWGDMLVIYGVDGRKIEAAKDKMTF